MKKIVVLGLVFLLSSCTLPWTDSDGIPDEHTFENDYKRHIHALFENVDTYKTDFYSLAEKLSPSGYDNSKIRALLSIPESGTGEITVQADAVRETRANKMGIEFLVTGFVDTVEDGTIRLEELKGGVIKDVISYYFRIDSAKISGSGKEFSDVQKSWDEAFSKLTPHFGKWIHYDVLAPAYAELGDESIALKVTMAFWIDFLSGGDKLQKILAEKPLLRSIESLGKQGDYYAYKVEADATTLLDFLDHAAREYTGSGLAQSTRDTMVEDMGTGALISGILSIHADKSEYMMFSGSLTDKVDSVSVELVYTPDETRLDLNGSNADETFQYLTKREGDTSDTTIRLNGDSLLTMKLMSKGTDIESLDATISLVPLQQDEAYQLLYKKDGNTNHIELNQLEPGLLTIDVNMANLDWHIEQERLSFLSGSVMDGMGGNATVNYTLTQDGELKAEITHPEIPGGITADGHYRDGDIVIDLVAAGISVSFSHKENNDNSVIGYLRLPVASLSWSGKRSGDFYESFKTSFASPVGTALLDMKTVDGWLAGPLSVKIPNSPQEIPQIDIRAKKKGKDFGLRVDVAIPELDNKKAHFEWDSTIDIRWDKDAKVEIPEAAIPSTDIFSGAIN